MDDAAELMVYNQNGSVHRRIRGRSALTSAQVVDDCRQVGSPKKKEALVQDLVQPGHVVLGE